MRPLPIHKTYVLIFFLVLLLCAPRLWAETGPGIEQERFETENDSVYVENFLETSETTSVEVSQDTPAVSAPSQEEAAFFVERIEVTGNTVVPSDDIRKIVVPYEGQELKLSQVKSVAEEITKLYHSKGYITCRAFIPAQKIETKTVQIQVFEGKLAQVKVQGNRFFREENITKFLKTLTGKVMEYDLIKKAVVKANLHPDREVKAVILPGQELGTSDLLIDVKDAPPFHISADVNNFGTKLTGKERYGVSFRHSNLSRRDDILAARFQWGEEVFAVGTQYVIPVGAWDTRIGASFNYTDVNIGGEFAALNIGGTAYTYSAFVNQPIASWRYVDLAWTGSFESKSIDNEVLGINSSNDELRMLHTGLNVDATDRYGRTFIVNDFTFGLSDFGASDRNDPRLSRAGSGGGFYKYNLALNRIHPIYDSTMLYLKAMAQSSPNSFVSAEQFDIGGVYSVRGYPQSDYLGDTGAGASFEVRVPFYFIPRDVKAPWSEETLWNRLNFTGFFDAASARLRSPAVGEDRSKTYMGAGGGIRFDLPRNLTGRFEWAAPIGDRPTDGSRSQFYFSVSGDLI